MPCLIARRFIDIAQSISLNNVEEVIDVFRLLAVVAIGYLATLVLDELTRGRIRPSRPGPRRRELELVPIAVFSGPFSMN